MHALVAAVVLAQEGALPEGLESRVDAIFAEFDGRRSPGCAVGVVKDGELVLAKGYGRADLEHDIPLGPNSLVPLASVSKSITAAAILIAARERTLSLEDDVRRFVPELPDLGTPITLQQLLVHTSGVRDYVTLWMLAGRSPSDAHSRETTLALLARQQALNFPPGSEFLYSNSGYFLLGLALERATGSRLSDYAREHLFEPLGMRHTRFVDDRHAIVEGRATGHLRRPDGSVGRVASNNEAVGAGGVASTIEDLASWERAFHTDALGLESVLVALAAAHGVQPPYSAGLSLGDFDGLTVLSHGGEGDGASTFLLRLPDIDFSVVCLCNVEGAGPASLAWRTAIAFLEGPYHAEVEALQHPALAPSFASLANDSLGPLAGDYRDPQTRAVWSVAVRGGELLLDRGQGRSILRPLSERRFRSPGFGPTIEATFEGPRMRVAIEGQRTVTLERAQLVQLEPEALEQYAGTYLSDELGVPWTLVVRDGALRFGELGDPPDPFRPTVRDEFALGPELRIRFARDAEDRIVSLSAHTERVWELCFVRCE